MTISDIARQVIDLIPNHHRWSKGSWEGRNGARLCVGAAVYELDLLCGERREFFAAFYDTAVALYPEVETHQMIDPLGHVIGVNDNALTSYEWIRTILEKLAARED